MSNVTLHPPHTEKPLLTLKGAKMRWNLLKGADDYGSGELKETAWRLLEAAWHQHPPMGREEFRRYVRLTRYVRWYL